MATIITIDTTLEKAFVNIAVNGKVIFGAENDVQRDHSSFVHSAIQTGMDECSLHFGNIDAVAVNAGPGSYTGIRVGLASAKGLCFSLKKPLIILNTLELLFDVAKKNIVKTEQPEPYFVCSMVDARRLEVFTAIYNQDKKVVFGPKNEILTENFINNFLLEQMVFVLGNGASKFEKINKSNNAFFFIYNIDNEVLAEQSYQNFVYKKFSDLAYSEPNYLKDFVDFKG